MPIAWTTACLKSCILINDGFEASSAVEKGHPEKRLTEKAGKAAH